MKKMTNNEIRNMWINYFTTHGHKMIESAPLVPINDDSLLWINAGVTPLKKYFDGTVTPEARRIVSIQKCIRTNDIENVGVTKRHHTFFEMMGNFSIGDYFKEEAIEFAYELLTGKDWFAIPQEKLYVTVYTEDEKAYQKWISVGMDENHIIKLDGNFWEIGEGPCGPDSEIFYDQGPSYDPKNDAFEKFKNDEDQDRYVEIWNNVFSQFNSKENVERKDYKELPHKNIDTGAGLERWCCIFQNVDSNFETDLFRPIIDKIEQLSGILYDGQTPFKVISDHIKAITFALADGAVFENTGRGYVLRRLLRRSVRFAKHLGFSDPFLYKLIPTVVEVMEKAYPYLKEKTGIIQTQVLQEEQLFLKTLDAGERRLQEIIESTKEHIISGYDAFKLYDTYGFPLELTDEIAREKGYIVNEEEFNEYMQKQRELAKKNARSKTAMASQKKVLMDFKKESTFVYGLHRLKSNILAIFSKDNLEKSLDHDGYIALKRTCFYAEAGGQVSDTGMIIGKNFKARVIDVFKGPNGQHIHKVKLLDGKINVGDDCEVVIDKDRRKAIEANHSSVHLLQYALQTCVDQKITQAGSYVDQDKLRFDFTSPKKLSDENLVAVENLVNEIIAKGAITSTEVMPIDKAMKLGAMALFGEKYGDQVRVVKIDKSIELCGGTHIANTKDIKKIAISSFETKGSNVYRIEAITQDKIEKTLLDIIKPYNDEMVKLLLKARQILEKAKAENIELTFDITMDSNKPTSYKDIIFARNELAYIQTEVKLLEKEYKEQQEKTKLANIDQYTKDIKEVAGNLYTFINLEQEDRNIVKSLADAICNHYDKEILVFITNRNEDGSVSYVCRNTTTKLNAGYIIKQASTLSEGNGGGSPTFAQGGGKSLIDLASVEEYIRETLASE